MNEVRFVGTQGCSDPDVRHDCAILRAASRHFRLEIAGPQRSVACVAATALVVSAGGLEMPEALSLFITAASKACSRMIGVAALTCTRVNAPFLAPDVVATKSSHRILSYISSKPYRFEGIDLPSVFKDYRRIIRVLCDVICVGAGSCCAAGAATVFSSEAPIFFRLYVLCGVVIGCLVGCSENPRARRLAAAMAMLMGATYLFICFVLWRSGRVAEFVAQEPLVLPSMALLPGFFVVALSLDWFVRRGSRTVESANQRSWWWLEGPLRLARACLAVWMLVAIGGMAAGIEPGEYPVWSLAIAYVLWSFLALGGLVGVWLLTSSTIPDNQ